jgi:hypothetical protein
MTDRSASLSRGSLKTPRAAAVAGILFAVLYGASLVIVRLSIPPGQPADTARLEGDFRMVSWALNLVPYAGIAFLWFIGVIRDRVGGMEDRLFATIFLGSGLLFLGLTFVGVAMAGGALASYSQDPNALLGSGVYSYNRAVMYNLVSVYAIRMAGVFMISLGTIWLRTGLMRRQWAFLTYALALVLLLSVSLSAWVTLIFPGWVLAVSVYFLIRTRQDRPEVASTDARRASD